MTQSNLIAFQLHITLMDGSCMENSIGAGTVFGAIEFVKAEALKNGWCLRAIECRVMQDEDLQDAVEVKRVTQ